MAKKQSVRELSKNKVATLRAKATKKGVKGVAKKTKAQLIKSLKPTAFNCSTAGRNLHSKKKSKKSAAGKKLRGC
jgi:hypothetical protein